jgi:hypothetical protein
MEQSRNGDPCMDRFEVSHKNLNLVARDTMLKSEQKAKLTLSKLTVIGLIISALAFILPCALTFVDLDIIWFALFGGCHFLIWVNIALAEVCV